MPIATLLSAGLQGIDATPIYVEIDITRGLPGWSTVGLPESAVRESKERVISSIHNCGYQFPFRRITLNLAPADVKKTGTAFDLPIAIGLLAAAEMIPLESLRGYAFLGELSLDGSLRPIRGALSAAALVKEQGWRGLILPCDNLQEAGLMSQTPIFGARRLPDVVEFLMGKGELLRPDQLPPICKVPERNAPDFSEVKGQGQAKRALEIAAAGFHNVMMVGPPGTGKSLLASCLPSILPPMSFEESLVTTKIYSLVGRLNPGAGMVSQRPFRAPHHGISDAGLIGGGNIPRPGEVSLAHNGVLFLDEIGEFKRHVLESLRQPLESRLVTISRARHSLSYPAGFLLAAAMNPCPCGHLGNPLIACVCSPGAIQRYQSKISGPLLDRFDLRLTVPSLPFDELKSRQLGETSAVIRERVVAAQNRQGQRLKEKGLRFNSQMAGADIRNHCRLGPEAESLLKLGMEKWAWSARAYHRILKVARTIADLDGTEEIEISHLSEAMAYRSEEKPS